MDDDTPVLVGGTGRSGSTVVGRLLDVHPELTLMRPMEVRFITGNDGFADALASARKKPGSSAAHEAAERAVDRLLHRWYRRAENVGLHQSIDIDTVNSLCDAYLAQFDRSPLEATTALVHPIMDAIARRLGAGRWVDTTPANARNADRVEPIYPRSRVVVVIRDGRDVAISFASQSFGPDDPFEALRLWEKRMLRAHRAALASTPGRVHVVDLADLVRLSRQQTLGDLLAFAQVDPDPLVQSWFDAHMSAEAAHVGRWRSELDRTTATRLDADYAAACDRLRAAGVRIPVSDDGSRG